MTTISVHSRMYPLIRHLKVLINYWSQRMTFNICADTHSKNSWAYLGVRYIITSCKRLHRSQKHARKNKMLFYTLHSPQCSVLKTRLNAWVSSLVNLTNDGSSCSGWTRSRMMEKSEDLDLFVYPMQERSATCGRCANICHMWRRFKAM